MKQDSTKMIKVLEEKSSDRTKHIHLGRRRQNANISMTDGCFT
jgi:hypothetical protein